MFSNIAKFIKGTVIYGIVGSFRSLMEFLLLPLYSRFLLPGDFGVLDIVMIFVMIGLVLAILEINNALFRFYFDYKSLRDRSKVVMTALASSSLNGLVIFIAVLVLGKNIAGFALNSPSYSHLFVLAAVYIMLDAMVTVPLNLLRIENKPVSYTTISLIQVIISFVGIGIFVILLKWGVAGILIAKNIAIIPTLVITLFKARRYLRPEFDFPLLKKMLKFSLPLIPAGAAIWGVNGLNRLFMLNYLTLEQIGYFSIGMKFVVPLTLSVIAFQLAWPQFALSKMNDRTAGKLYSEVFSVFIAFETYLILFLALFAGAIIPRVMTTLYYPAVKVILPLSLGMFFYGVFYFLGTGEFIKKSTVKIIPPIVIALMINIPLNFFLTPRYGIVGTSWVMAVSYFCMTATMFLLSREFSLLILDWKRLMRLVIPFAILLFISVKTQNMNSINMLGLKLIIFLFFPLLLVISGFFDKNRLGAIRNAIQTRSKPEKIKSNECVETPAN